MSDWLRFVERARTPAGRSVRLHMVEELRCAARSQLSGRRCTREWKHAGDHERRRRSGAPIEVWPRYPGDDAPSTSGAYVELLEHLDDLIDLARAEGQGRFVAVLTRARNELQFGPPGQAPRRRGGRPPLLR